MTSRTRFVFFSLAVAALTTGVHMGSTEAQSTQTPAAPAGERQPGTYPLGPDSLPQEGVPKGTLEGPLVFKSQILAGTVRRYWIYVPAQYDGSTPANVLVFQDGQRATNPQGSLRVPQAMENLIAKGEMPVTIGVFVTPGNLSETYPTNLGMSNPNNRRNEYDALDDRYARMLIDELLPEVGKKYRLTNDPEKRVIGGTSSGAIAAFTAAWQRPDYFRRVISMIGSFTDIHGGHVYPQLVRESDRKPIRIFLQDGVNDLRSPNNLDRDWHLQNQKMVAAFQERGYDMAYVFGRGAHSDDHGGAILPYMLRWIWRDYRGVTPPSEDLIAAAAAPTRRPGRGGSACGCGGGLIRKCASAARCGCRRSAVPAAAGSRAGSGGSPRATARRSAAGPASASSARKR